MELNIYIPILKKKNGYKRSIELSKEIQFVQTEFLWL